MDCQELILLLSDLLDDELDETSCCEANEHIAHCPFCRPIFLSFRMTVRSISCCEQRLPSGTHQRLRKRLIYYSRTVTYRRRSSG